MTEKTENTEKIEKIEKIDEIEKVIVKITYEWAEPKTEVELTLFPNTNVAKLLGRLGNKINRSDLAFFHGDVELDGAKTFAECNIPEGVILTVRQAPAPDVKRKREDSPPPDPEDVLKGASMKVPVKEKTPPLPAA
jgi:hypothetical protein